MSELAALLWPLVALYAIVRIASVADKAIDRLAPLPASVTDSEPQVPEDLMALAMTHSEGWAQEDTIKAIRERYAELKDWQKVRFAFGIGRIE